MSRRIGATAVSAAVRIVFGHVVIGQQPGERLLPHPRRHLQPLPANSSTSADANASEDVSATKTERRSHRLTHVAE
jgi:hypothetical protein